MCVISFCLKMLFMEHSVTSATLRDLDIFKHQKGGFDQKFEVPFF